MHPGKAIKSSPLPRGLALASIGRFIVGVIAELRKVVTPTRKELAKWTIAVFVFVILLMLFVTALDFGLGKLILLILG